MDSISLPKDMDGRTLYAGDVVELGGGYVGTIERIVISVTMRCRTYDGRDDDPWSIRVVDSLVRDDCEWTCWTCGSEVKLLRRSGE